MVGLADIQFPVYLVGKEKPQEHEGILFYHRCDKEGNDIKLILDNRNWHHETLAHRRLKIMMDGTSKLSKLTHAIFFIGDLIKLSTPKTWFIDSLGKLFIYTKSGSAKLIIRKIEQVIQATGSTIIVVEGIQTRFKCLYAPKFEKFAGLLKIGHMYILYGLYEEEPKETRRAV